MAITFMGYLDDIEEQLKGKRRCLFLCDAAADIVSLPTTGFALPSGGNTAIPAPGSMAVVGGGGAAQFLSNAAIPAWGAL